MRELRKGLIIIPSHPTHARHRHYGESELAELDRDGHRPRVHIDFKMLFDERQRRPYIGIEVQDPAAAAAARRPPAPVHEAQQVEWYCRYSVDPEPPRRDVLMEDLSAVHDQHLAAVLFHVDAEEPQAQDQVESEEEIARVVQNQRRVEGVPVAEQSQLRADAGVGEQRHQQTVPGEAPRRVRQHDALRRPVRGRREYFLRRPRVPPPFQPFVPTGLRRDVGHSRRAATPARPCFDASASARQSAPPSSPSPRRLAAAFARRLGPDDLSSVASAASARPPPSTRPASSGTPALFSPWRGPIAASGRPPRASSGCGLHAAMILESVAWSNASASTKDCGPARTPQGGSLHPQFLAVVGRWRRSGAPLTVIATPSRRTNPFGRMLDRATGSARRLASPAVTRRVEEFRRATWWRKERHLH